jgi:TonB family protein
MEPSNRRRLGLAIVISFLAHVTTAVVLTPLFALERAVRVLFEEDAEALRIGLFLALLLHLALLLPLAHWLLTIDEEITSGEMLTVDLWTADQEAKLERKREKTPEELLEEYEPEEEVPEGQVVEAPPSKDKRKPDKARFLAEQDSRVEKETKSSVRTRGSAQPQPQPELTGKGQETETAQGGMRAEQHGVGPIPPEFQRSDDGQRSAEKRAPKSLLDINLEPSKEAMTSALAGSGLDHLDGIIDGDATALNTMGWRYASFFNRVKRKVERHWHPDVEYRRHDPYGNIYGFKDRVTVLLVVLRPDGSLKKAYVMEPSGALFLDDEAREAVMQAAPFPNVPPGLMDKRDGLVKFTFHFLVQVGEQPIFRMRRYQ